MTLKNIVYIVSIVLVLAFSSYFGGFSGFIQTIIAIFIYGNIFFVFHIIWKKLRKKQIEVYRKYLFEFAKKVSLAIVIVFVILGSFAYYENEISRAVMPEITISNGQKTVVFQAMSHIGSSDFYATIKENIIKYKKDGFVYFFEGVKPGTKENMDNFNQALGIKFEADLYKNFSKLYGVVHQDNSIFLGLVNNLDFNVDLNIDQIMALYKVKLNTGNTGEIKKELPLDVNAKIIETLSFLNDRQLKILVYINQAILNFIIKSDKLQDFMTSNFANKALFDVILEERNKNLISEIQNSKFKNIYITYGLMHFDGVFEMLKKQDSKWKIVKTKEFYPIK